MIKTAIITVLACQRQKKSIFLEKGNSLLQNELQNKKKIIDNFRASNSTLYKVICVQSLIKHEK